MLKKVLKYTLERKSYQEVEMPAGATVISVEEQDSRVVVYAVVSVDSIDSGDVDIREFFVLSTGNEFFDATNSLTDGNFIGTVTTRRNVLHVFLSPLKVAKDEGNTNE